MQSKLFRWVKKTFTASNLIILSAVVALLLVTFLSINWAVGEIEKSVVNAIVYGIGIGF